MTVPSNLSFAVLASTNVGVPLMCSSAASLASSFQQGGNRRLNPRVVASGELWRDYGVYMPVSWRGRGREYGENAHPQTPDWPKFTWDSKGLAPLLSGARLRQGLLPGKMRSYGFASQWRATLKVLTEEIIKSSAILTCWG